MSRVLTILHRCTRDQNQGTSLRVLQKDPGLPKILERHRNVDNSPRSKTTSISRFLQGKGLTLRQARELIPEAKLTPRSTYHRGKKRGQEIGEEILDSKSWCKHIYAQVLPENAESLQKLADFLQMPIVVYARYHLTSTRSPEKLGEVNPR